MSEKIIACNVLRQYITNMAVYAGRLVLSLGTLDWWIPQFKKTEIATFYDCMLIIFKAFFQIQGFQGPVDTLLTTCQIMHS